jgi:hypothetical protein
MKMRQLVLLTFSAALLACTAGCELLVDFDRNKIDSAIATPDACVTDCEDAGADSGSDASDDDGGMMDAMVIGDAGSDADVTMDSGTDSGGMVDAAMDGSDDEDSGL